MMSQSAHSSLSLRSKLGRSCDSYRAVLDSGSRSATLPLLPAAVVLAAAPVLEPVLELPLSSSPHAATPIERAAADRTASHFVLRMGGTLLLEVLGTGTLGGKSFMPARASGGRRAWRRSRRPAGRGPARRAPGRDLRAVRGRSPRRRPRS